eukprot:592165-Amphidinium_carterae.1
MLISTLQSQAGRGGARNYSDQAQCKQGGALVGAPMSPTRSTLGWGGWIGGSNEQNLKSESNPHCTNTV